MYAAYRNLGTSKVSLYNLKVLDGHEMSIRWALEGPGFDNFGFDSYCGFQLGFLRVK